MVWPCKRVTLQKGDAAKEWPCKWLRIKPGSRFETSREIRAFSGGPFHSTPINSRRPSRDAAIFQ